MIERKKILWLVSWYPNKYEPFAGDFIQRHARAAAVDNDIHVIFVKDSKDILENIEEINVQNGLTEQIIYFKISKGFLSKINKQKLYFQHYLKAFESYKRKKGLPNILHVHVPWKAGLIALWLKWKYKIPYLITEHWTIYNDDNPSTFDKYPNIIKKLFSLIYYNSSGLTPVSHDLGKRLHDLFNIETIQVINNVVEDKYFYYYAENYTIFKFIHVSSLSEQKNIFSIIKVFMLFYKRFKNCQLYIIGPASEMLIKLIKSTGLYGTHIIVIGEISYLDVAKHMKSSNCLLLFSNYENSPCVIGEALCCGLPVISTDVGGISELLNDKNGILIPPRDEQRLLEAMDKILLEYKNYDRSKIAKDSLKKFGFNSISDQFYNLYSKFNIK